MPKITRRSFIIGSSVALLSYLYFERNSIAVKEYTIGIDELPKAFEGFTILHFSDLHSKLFGEKQAGLLNLIKKYNYDLVAITGDIDNKYSPNIEPGLQLISGLKNKPIYFVPGNHEWSTGFKFRETLLNNGVKVLTNSAEKFTKKGEYIWVVGVDDPYTGRENLEQALANVKDQAPRILLAHAPEIYPTAIKSKIDLVLVGHTHGGQIRLPFFGAIIAPGQGFFPKLDYGLYSTKSTKMIITAGLGESGLPIRINIRPEIVFIKLTAKV